MVTVNETLKKYLLEVSPLLNEVDDSQIFLMFENDLRNYLKYLEHRHPKQNSEAFYTYMRGRILGEYWEEYQDAEMEKLLHEFMTEWSMFWWKKFKERTELAINIKDDIPKSVLELSLKGRNSLVMYFTKEERNELEEYLMNILYTQREYCCTAHLSHSLLEQHLGHDTWQKKKVFTHADKLEFMHIVGSEARRMCERKGKLIFIRADFKKFLREWRNDNAAVQS